MKHKLLLLALAAVGSVALMCSCGNDEPANPGATELFRGTMWKDSYDTVVVYNDRDYAETLSAIILFSETSDSCRLDMVTQTTDPIQDISALQTPCTYSYNADTRKGFLTYLYNNAGYPFEYTPDSKTLTIAFPDDEGHFRTWHLSQVVQ
ncbi:MAG: hypothetical protein IJ634_00495 [Bacteroidales bacterium]|nr:hypothetical protein [Bacteroidales bacterium]